MEKSSTSSFNIYMFSNSRFCIQVKAMDMVSAIEWLKIIFGESWVRFHLDQLDVCCLKSYDEPVTKDN